jgi:hypothetical protein
VLYAEGVPGAMPTDRIFVVDDRNNVYAFDRSSTAASPAWKKTLGPPWSGSMPAGIIGTPVISSDKKRIYLVSHQDDGGTSRHYVYVLDTDKGETQAKVEVAASFPLVGSPVAAFASAHELQDAALTLDGRELYVGFSADDADPKARGWVLAYDVASTVPVLVNAFVTTPNGLAIGTPCGPIANQGSVSQGGNGFVADGAGHIYLQVGNGAYEPTARANGLRNAGNAVVRLDESVVLEDAWAVTYASDTHVAFESCDSRRVQEEAPWSPTMPHSVDFLTWSGLDLGTAGPLPLPPNRLLVGGSEGFWFLLDRGFTAGSAPPSLRATHNGQVGVPTIADVPAYDQFEKGKNAGADFALNWPRISGSPVYWGDADKGTLYVWGTKDSLRAYHYSAADGVDAAVVGVGLKRMPRYARTGAMLTVSGRPGDPPIVWTSSPLDHDFGHGRRYGGILRAYSGAPVGGTLVELWNSGTDPLAREGDGVILGYSARTPPTVAKGFVYLPSWNQLGPHAAGQINVYGPKPANPLRALTNGPDFDGDGQADVIWSDEATPSAGVWLLDPWMHEPMEVGDVRGYPTADPAHPGEPAFTVYDEVAIPDAADRGVGWRLAGAGDFDSDGQPDLVWTQTHVDTTSGAIVNDANEVWLTARFDPVRNVLPIRRKVKVEAGLQLDWKLVGTGDFDGDGISDLLWRHPDGWNGAWIMPHDFPGREPVHARMYATMAQASPAWEAAGAGADWDHDGIADIVWRCSAGFDCDGANSLWLMKKLDEVTQEVPLRKFLDIQPQAEASHWKIVAIGDYNRDGDPGLVWWDSNDGATWVWMMHEGAPFEAGWQLWTCASHETQCSHKHRGPGQTTSPTWTFVGPR